jgi:hypothetical protein
MRLDPEQPDEPSSVEASKDAAGGGPEGQRGDAVTTRKGIYHPDNLPDFLKGVPINPNPENPSDYQERKVIEMLEKSLREKEAREAEETRDQNPAVSPPKES